MENDTIIIINEFDEEIEMKILFTVESVVSQKNIVCYIDPEDEDGPVYASYYDDEDNLSVIEDDKEWEFIEEVFGAFLEDHEEEFIH